MSRSFRRARSVFSRIGITAFPMCVALGGAGVVPNKSDAPSYVQDVFNDFKGKYSGDLKPSTQPKPTNPMKPKKTVKVGLIGAGPSGLALMNAFNYELQREGDKDVNFELTVFEKQSKVGGLWNYNWQTGTNEYGATVHASQYRHLWSNGPKECLEMSDYTFDTHFNGTELGSFPPRPVLRDYIVGRAKARDLEKKFDVRFNHNIINVRQTDDDKFELIYEDLVNNTSGSDIYDYVVVATGHFSVPNMVEFKGFDKFQGRIIHSHSFRNANEFKGQNILVIGASYSAEDIGLQCWKFGAKNVTISYRTKPMGFNWPKGMREVPLLKEIQNGKDAVFSNGEVVEDIDSIILCTGYLHSFPFLPTDLKLKTNNTVYPAGLYKGMVWLQNPKCFYLGMQDQWYTFTMFDLQALYAKDLILDRVQLPDVPIMINDAAQWKAREREINSDYDSIRFQSDYIIDLYNQLLDPKEYVDSSDKIDYTQEFMEWEHDKHSDITTYRDKVFKSKVSGKEATTFNTPWIYAFDDSITTYLDGCKSTKSSETVSYQNELQENTPYSFQ